MSAGDLPRRDRAQRGGIGRFARPFAEPSGACGFRCLFALFALGCVAGLMFVAFGPVPFIRGLGTVAVACAALGMMVALAGRALAAPAADAPSLHEAHREPVLGSTSAAPAAVETSIDERLPVWPGITQPV